MPSLQAGQGEAPGRVAAARRTKRAADGRRRATARRRRWVASTRPGPAATRPSPPGSAPERKAAPGPPSTDTGPDPTPSLAQARCDEANEHCASCSLPQRAAGAAKRVGAPCRSAGPVGLKNVGRLILGGRVLFEQAKCLLPTYDVFDEARYFTSSEFVEPVEISINKKSVNIIIYKC